MGSNVIASRIQQIKATALVHATRSIPDLAPKLPKPKKLHKPDRKTQNYVNMYEPRT